jgi:hypothetical protein
MKTFAALALLLSFNAMANTPGINCSNGKVSFNGNEPSGGQDSAEISQAPSSGTLILSRTSTWVDGDGQPGSLSLHSEVIGYDYNEQTKVHTYKILSNYTTYSNGDKREPLEFTVDASKIVRVIPQNPTAKLYRGSLTVVDPLDRFTMKYTYDCTVRNIMRNQ